MQRTTISHHLLCCALLGAFAVQTSTGCLSARDDADDGATDTNGGDGDEGSSTSGDGDTGDDATSGDGDGGDGDSTDVTIYDVQQGNIIEGSVVQINDIIVTSPTEIDPDNNSGTLYAQEPGGGEYSGIAVYLYSEVAAANTLQEGDVISITAEYTEYFGLSELVVKSPADLSVVGNGPAVEPEVVNGADVATNGPLAENYEGVLIQVENATASMSDGFGGWFLDTGLLLDFSFLFATNDAPTVNMGDSFSSITGPLSFGFDEFRILPRTPSDLADQSVTPPMAVTIPEIQQGMIAEGAYVELTGVVATTGLTFSQDTFYVQDPAGGEYSGIQVYVGTGFTGTVSPGETMTITGYYGEYFDMSQIEATAADSIEVTGTGTVPTPPVVAPADIATNGAMAENYEGVPVTVANVTVTDADPTNGMSMNVFEVTDGLLIQNTFLDTATEWPTVANNDTFSSITGPVLYSFSEFKLAPPTTASLVP